MGKKLSITAFIFSILFFVPFAPIIGLILGIIARKKAIYEGDLKGLATAAIAISSMFLIATAIFLYIIFSPAPPTPAGTTNSYGQIYGLSSEGIDLPFTFIDETTGNPIRNLSVGVALHENKSAGVLVLLDRQERYPPQIILLQGTGSTPKSGEATERAIERFKVEVSKTGSNIIKTKLTDQLPKDVNNMINDANVVSDLIALGVKAIATSLPQKVKKDIEKTNNLEIGETQIITSDELRKELIRSEAEKKVKALITVPTDIGKHDVVGTIITLTDKFIDWQYMKTCEELPGAIGLKYRKIGMYHYVSDCKFSYEDNLPMWPTVLNTATNGSLEVFSKANIGYGMKYNLSPGENTINLPQGEYEYVIRLDKFSPLTLNLTNSEQAKTKMDIGFPAPDIKEPPKETVSSTKLGFGYIPRELDKATVGKEYNYSFCKPTPSSKTDLCGGFEQTTSPYGGQPPYTFQLDTMGGFPPHGIILNLNGLLTGTPTAAGTSTFTVCAIDQVKSETCKEVSIVVEDTYVLTVNKVGDGLVETNSGEVNCGPTCTVEFEQDDYVYLKAKGEEDSVFIEWTGDCTGTKARDCDLKMDSNKTVTAHFATAKVTIDSATCTLDRFEEYANGYARYWNVQVTGTATGPEGTEVSILSNILSGDLQTVCPSWGPGKLQQCGRNPGEPETTGWTIENTDVICDDGCTMRWRAVLFNYGGDSEYIDVECIV